MCLTIPGRVAEILEEGPGGRRATVDYGDQHRSASLLYLPEVAVGDYVVVQAGFAIARLEAAEALEALRYVEEMNRSAVMPSAVPGGPAMPAKGEEAR